MTFTPKGRPLSLVALPPSLRKPCLRYQPKTRHHIFTSFTTTLHHNTRRTLQQYQSPTRLTDERMGTQYLSDKMLSTFIVYTYIHIYCNHRSSAERFYVARASSISHSFSTNTVEGGFMSSYFNFHALPDNASHTPLTFDSSVYYTTLQYTMQHYSTIYCIPSRLYLR